MTSIFDINSQQDFEKSCIETFHYQFQHCAIYRQFVTYLNRNPNEINSIQDIPFLPIEMFKKHTILSDEKKAETYFKSSGTTSTTSFSTHYIADLKLYEESIYKSFDRFIGKPDDYIFLGLLPNYIEKGHSSLVYMVNFLMESSKKPENGFYLYNHQELAELLTYINKENKKVILFGVSFALLDFIDFLQNKSISLPKNDNFKVIETGGMKGRKKEITKDVLLQQLQNGFETTNIFSEYSMTELLSQAYSLGENKYQCPSWMSIQIRSLEDPFAYLENGRTGAINIIDLANKNSCSFIATQDLGRINLKPNHTTTFEVLGRMDNSDIRGCSLLVS